jgi:two-component system chemotaxis response regulator CheY
MQGKIIKDFRDIIDWLLTVETLAENVYASAAEEFSKDKPFADFIRRLADDETQHLNVVKLAEQLTFDEDGISSVISISEQAQKSVEGHFLSCEELLRKRGLTKDTLLDCLVSAEYSEWNDVFLYVVNTMKHRHREFIPMAAKIGQHKKTIERYLKSDPKLFGYLKRIKRLPDIWSEKILVVDDSDIIVDLLTSIFEDEGCVVTATNGREALEKLGKGYFSAIISDFNMPVMNGMEFYREAVGLYPDFKERFLLFTSEAGEEFRSFVKENEIRCLTKPANIKDVRNGVIEILSG